MLIGAERVRVGSVQTDPFGTAEKAEDVRRLSPRSLELLTFS